MPQSVNEFKNRRLFYRKYLYSIRVKTSIAEVFRKSGYRGTPDTATGIKRYRDSFNAEFAIHKKKARATSEESFLYVKSYKTISKKDIDNAEVLFKALSGVEDYRVRVEGYKVSVFTNDEDFCLNLVSNLKGQGHDLYMPDPEYKDFLVNNANVIIVNKKPELEYKITLNGKKTGIPELQKWLTANQDKSGVSPTVLRQLKNNRWVDGCYFYIRDGKVLTLLTMLAGSAIRRVDKLVYSEDIDK